MRPVHMGVLLLAAAGLLYAALTVPVRRDASSVLAQSRRLQEQRREARTRLMSFERRATARRRAVEALSTESAATTDAPAALRRSVLRSLEGLSVSGVRLEVRPGGPPLVATLRLAAEGPTAEILRLTDRLAQPGSSVVLGQVRLRPSGRGLLLELDGVTPGRTP